MSRVVHYDIMFPERWECGHKWVRTVCNIEICCQNRHLNDILTSDISSVTCEKCKEKLGIKPALVVDEEKKRWARFILNAGYRQYEIGGPHECFDCGTTKLAKHHSACCIVMEAENYLSSIKEAE